MPRSISIDGPDASESAMASAAAIHASPRCSVIIPCRNEARFIGACLDSVLANDYPRDRLEILVVDGMSEDGTPAIVREYASRHPHVVLVENPKRITPAALNIGIHRATGQIIMRMDAHAAYDPQYIPKCLRALDKYSADNVGGIWKIQPRSESAVGKAVVQSLSHRFGIGNAYYRLSAGRQPRSVDTVPFFCLRRETLERVGGFNESLPRGQDLEFSLRLRRAGCVTMLVPDIVCYYYARTDLPSFLRHNWKNGAWALLPFLYTDEIPVAARHLVPLAFVLWVIVTGLLAISWPFGRWLFLGGVMPYVVANVLASIDVAVRQQNPMFLLSMPFVFAALHFSYGLGSLKGLIEVAATLLRRAFTGSARESIGG